MKLFHFSSFQGRAIFSIAALAAVATQVDAQISREELIARRDAAKKQAARFQPKEGGEAGLHPSRSSILDRSLLLTSERNWTFIPKGSAFSVPEKYKDQVNVQEGKGKYLPFAEFVRKNRGWLSTYSVTLEQARGNAPISKEVRLALKESGRVVVSVCKGGPISTRPSKVAITTAQN